MSWLDSMRGWGQSPGGAVVPELLTGSGVDPGLGVNPYGTLQAANNGLQGVPGTVPPGGGGILGRIMSFGTQNGQALGGLLQGAGSLWGAYNSGQQLGLAKDAFGLQKRAFETNLANSIASYNTALEDKIRGRSSNPNEDAVSAYLSQNKLKG